MRCAVCWLMGLVRQHSSEIHPLKFSRPFQTNYATEKAQIRVAIYLRLPPGAPFYFAPEVLPACLGKVPSILRLLFRVVNRYIQNAYPLARGPPGSPATGVSRSYLYVQEYSTIFPNRSGEPPCTYILTRLIRCLCLKCGVMMCCSSSLLKKGPFLRAQNKSQCPLRL